MKYVSLDLAKKHLYIETEYTDDDSIIGVYVAAAEGAVANHIRRELDTLEDSEGKLPYPSCCRRFVSGSGSQLCRGTGAGQSRFAGLFITTIH